MADLHSYAFWAGFVDQMNNDIQPKENEPSWDESYANGLQLYRLLTTI